MNQPERHDCGNLECSEYQKQMVLDSIGFVVTEAFALIDEQTCADPVEAIEYGVSLLRGYMNERDEIRQAQSERAGQPLH